MRVGRFDVYRIWNLSKKSIVKRTRELCNEPQILDTLLIRQHGTEFCTEQDLVLLILP